MTEPINRVTLRNPDVFPVPAVRRPEIRREERERRDGRERRDRWEPRERARDEDAPPPAPPSRPARSDRPDDDGDGPPRRIDVIA